jgi:dTDP-4-amino-4,6-dideoxygalactose transaminase
MTLDPAGLSGLFGPRTRAIVVTHLYGRMAPVLGLRRVASQHGLALVEDCAQAHGAELEGRRAGSWGDVGCFSFYPTKNLGALGDGGALVTSDGQVAQRARKLRQYGWRRKYEAEVTGGRNSRLDELQAAILRAKLPYLQEWNRARARVAEQYRAGLSGAPLRLPAEAGAGEMVYHLYVVRSAERDWLRDTLGAAGIGCEVHYPVPDHLQAAYADMGYRRGSLPLTERVAHEVLSLPCFAELSTDEVDQVIRSVWWACAERDRGREGCDVEG